MEIDIVDSGWVPFACTILIGLQPPPLSMFWEKSKQALDVAPPQALEVAPPPSMAIVPVNLYARECGIIRELYAIDI